MKLATLFVLDQLCYHRGFFVQSGNDYTQKKILPLLLHIAAYPVLLLIVELLIKHHGILYTMTNMMSCQLPETTAAVIVYMTL